MFTLFLLLLVVIDVNCGELAFQTREMSSSSVMLKASGGQLAHAENSLSTIMSYLGVVAVLDNGKRLIFV